MATYGLDFALPYAGDPDPTLPWADDDDSLLVPGSLVLYEPAHSANPVVGVPASGASIPNIAWKRAAALLGSGDVNSLALSRSNPFAVASGADVANQMLTERTTLGGIHVIVSQTNAQVQQGWAARGPAAIEAYLQANLDHSYYISRWDRLTRAATADVDPGEMIIGQNTTALIALSQPEAVSSGGTLPLTSSGKRLGLDSSPASNFRTTLGNRFLSVGVSAHSGSPTFLYCNLSIHGVVSPWGATYQNKAGSRVDYRAYLEDLTVSGRTYAQVEALDFALWQAAFGTGGRYNGDTIPTNPSTIP